MARILLIDDEPQVRMVLEGFLAHDGHEVTTAEDGKMALRLIDKEHYDLIVTDIVMPEQDGYEVIMALSGRPERPKIIAVSGGSPSLPQKMLLNVVAHMPVEQVLAKPVSYEELSQAVTAALSSPPLKS